MPRTLPVSVKKNDSLNRSFFSYFMKYERYWDITYSFQFWLLYGIIILYFCAKGGIRHMMTFLKVIFCIMLCVPLAYVLTFLFENLVDDIAGGNKK